jgi:hypothetical protein
MSLSRDDLRAAVAAGMISEAQAASVLALSEARAGVREHASGLDEPFELFKGFNEIFIVVGLVILYAGWMGITGVSAVTSLGPTTASFAVYAGITMATSAALAAYFTLKRRMVAPSIALTIMFGLAALQLGASLGWQWGLNFQERAVATGGMATLAMLLVRGVPHPVLHGARGARRLRHGGVGADPARSGAAAPGGAVPALRRRPVRGADHRWGSWIVGVAMAFDMSDPHRVTRRGQPGSGCT